MKLEDIRNISVIGAGTMGHGIGLTYALGGYKVTLNDTSEALLSNAINHIRDDLKTLSDNELISPDMIESTLSRITTTAKLEEAAKDADFVTEAVSENVDVKRKVFSALDTLCPERTILASNTSSLVTRDFASQCKRQDKILITHWVNPPHIVPAVEVVRAGGTSDDTMDVIYNLLKKVKKVPVKIMKETPGFIINYVQYGLIRQVWSLWQQGIASPEDIDTVVKASFGFRLAAIGPLETCDLGGLHIWYAAASQLFKILNNDREPPEELKKMVEAGELGLKSGKGFFNYNVSYADKGQDESVKVRDKKFIQLLKLLYS
jgi:3-hydroxybutyryl-CoA dehydrogenase